MKVKKFLSNLFIGVLVFFSVIGNVQAENNNYVNKKEDFIDSVSKIVIDKGLYENEKIEKYESLTEGVKACHELTETSSDVNEYRVENLNNNENLENCVIVKTKQDIAFDTEKVVGAIRYDKNYYIKYETKSDALDAVKILETYPTVKYAVTDKMVSYDMDDYIKGDAKTSQDANGYSHYTWGADVMGLPAFADYVSKTTMKKTVVAVLDSGIKKEHELFQGRLQEGYDFVNDDNNPRDDQGHGTHVAGIIADCTQGTNVNILPVKVLKIDGLTLGTQGTLGDLLAGIQYAIQKDVDVINLSMGSYSSDFEPFCEEIDEAVLKGIVVVAASGNDYKLIDSKKIHPAHKENIIVTAAIDSNLQNYHNSENSGSNYGSSIDVTAPGVDVKSAFHGIFDNINNKYVMKTGTSMAAPHISAAAAMLKMQYPNYTCEQIEKELKSCAKDLGESGYDQYYGAGLPILSDLITSLPFADVSENDWFYDGLLKVYSKGYMTGKTKDCFMPFDNEKRQDIAVILYRMSNSPFVEYREIYNDVTKEDYFSNASVWAYDNNIMTGYTNGNFGVDDNIIRQDFMVTLYRYAQSRGMNVAASADLNDYVDQDQVRNYARKAMEWGVAKGIIGKSTVSLNPYGNASRAEVATMVERFMREYNL